MNIFIPTNGGKSFVYIPTTTSHQSQSSQGQPTEGSQVNPVVGCIIVGVCIALLIALVIWCNRMMKG